MSDQRPRRDAVKIVPGPVEMRHQRSQRQRRIGHAAGNDNLGPCPYGIGNGAGTQIRIDGDDVPIDRRQAAIPIPALSL
ncbi:hypothetical protein D3C72_1933230 [compost metagenome]